VRQLATFFRKDTLVAALFHPNQWVRLTTILGLCLAAAIIIGTIIGLLGALYGSALLIALAIAYVMLRVPIFGLMVLIANICLLPFAALPVDLGFTPTFLDLVLLGIFFVWICLLVTHHQGPFIADFPTGIVLLFLGLAIASFVAGLGHAQLTASLARRFFEIILSILTFLLVLNTVRTEAQLRLLVLTLIACGALAALIGIVLYFLPESLTIRLLSALRVVRYPSGSDVLRYIEDNPELPLRATSTSIDPNVLGGLLIFTGTNCAAQVMAERPILPRWLLALALLLMMTCLILTYSRSSFLGLACALFLLALLRHRRLLWLELAGLVVLALLPATQSYVRHFIEGLRGEDLATQMRFGEYKDALILISRHPWIGVGFAGTPEIDTYIGVSSVYLLIAEEMGIIGLGAFSLALLGFQAIFLRAHFRGVLRGFPLEATVYGLCLAVAGGMVGGLLDHYLFNLVFPHASTLLWFTIGLGTAGIRLAKQRAAIATDAPA